MKRKYERESREAIEATRNILDEEFRKKCEGELDARKLFETELKQRSMGFRYEIKLIFLSMKL